MAVLDVVSKLFSAVQAALTAADAWKILKSDWALDDWARLSEKSKKRILDAIDVKKKAEIEEAASKKRKGKKTETAELLLGSHNTSAANPDYDGTMVVLRDRLRDGPDNYFIERLGAGYRRTDPIKWGSRSQAAIMPWEIGDTNSGPQTIPGDGLIFKGKVKVDLVSERVSVSESKKKQIFKQYGADEDGVYIL